MNGYEEYCESMRARLPGFDAISKARVGIAGLGGLGSHVAMMLARTGVGYLKIVDFDTVDASNINRQNYYRSDIGKLKTDATKEHLEAANPYIRIEAENVKLAQSNQYSVFKDCDIVVEAFDKAEMKTMLISAISSECPEKWIVSGNGLAGTGPQNLIRTTSPASHLIFCGDGESDITPGVALAAPRVMTVAGHQANAVIRIILGQDPVARRCASDLPSP